jgi:hypothetical protein
MTFFTQNNLSISVLKATPRRPGDPSTLQNGRLGVQVVAHCLASPLRLKNYAFHHTLMASCNMLAL